MSAPAPDDTMEAEGHGGAGPDAVPLLAAGAAAPVALGYTMTTAKHELNESEAKLEKAEAKLEKAKTELEKAKGTDDEESAKTYYAAVLEGVTTAQRGVTTAQRGVDTAQRGVDTAQTVVAAATDQVLAAQKREKSPCTSYCRTLTVSSTSLSSPSQRCTKLRAPMTLFPLFATSAFPAQRV